MGLICSQSIYFIFIINFLDKNKLAINIYKYINIKFEIRSMELSTFLLIFLGIAGSALSRSIHASSGQQQQQQQSVDEATSRDSSSMVDYLADSVKDAQAYRLEVVRELELLNRVSAAIREHPSALAERQLLVADLIDRLSWSYGHLDQYIDLFVPEEKDLTNELLSSENTSSNDGDVEAAKLSKRAWPKRMYNTKYSNIPVIRTGK